MRRLLIVLLALLISASLWFVFMGADTLAEKQIRDRLAQAGFKDITIGDISSGPASTAATSIKLDNKGIDAIQSITISQGWTTIFSDNDQADITIVSPDIYRTIEHVNSIIPGMMTLNRATLAQLPKGRLVVRDGRFNIASPLGDFQFLFDVVVETPAENGKRLVTATAKSTQPSLDFTSEWRGWIEQDGTLLADALVPEIKTQIGPVRLTRGNGWFSLSNTGEYPALSGQIESGGASLGTLPLQNFSLTIDASRDSMTVMTRAQASGADRTMIATDVVMENEQRRTGITITSENLPSFFTWLDQSLGRPTDILRKAFDGKTRLELAVDYQLAKRFAGGPYPFDMRGTLDTEEFLSGTFLIYPGSFDMRGSAKVNQDYIPAIREYFKLPDASISGEYIRLDASLAPFISGVSAGIENDAGERP